jgi:hypothetical protein
MTLTYRGVPYTTDHRDGAVIAKTLTYRGNSYSNLHPTTGTCQRVQLEEVYRGIKHEETKTVCA